MIPRYKATHLLSQTEVISKEIHEFISPDDLIYSPAVLDLPIRPISANFWHTGESPLAPAGAGHQTPQAWNVYDTDGLRIFTGNPLLPQPIQQANALMTAAAPELFAALHRCLTVLARHEGNDTPEAAAFRQGTQAIAAVRYGIDAVLLAFEGIGTYS